jgi:hypothetical protein
MTEEELAAIPRRSAKDILVDTNRTGVSGEATIAAALNEEWWRGFHAGRAAAGFDRTEWRDTLTST